MKKEMFLKQFPKESEYLASKIFNAYEMASEYEIISFTEEFYTPNFWKKFQKKMRLRAILVICAKTQNTMPLEKNKLWRNLESWRLKTFYKTL